MRVDRKVGYVLAAVGMGVVLSLPIGIGSEKQVKDDSTTITPDGDGIIYCRGNAGSVDSLSHTANDNRILGVENGNPCLIDTRE